ncbi:MAG: uroporphyrinogen-III synthase [Magnetococcales bacterium]|nr:uroporphyrinogen-III synthase [Magnetococcales bacterium]
MILKNIPKSAKIALSPSTRFSKAAAMNLADRIILVTRPEPGASESARLIARHGGVPLLAPVMTIQPMADPLPFQHAMATLDRFDAVLLTSANGARAFVAALPEGVTPPPLFAVGHKTARLLTNRGWTPQVPERPMGGESLGKTVLERFPAARSFLFPRAEEGREELIGVLEQAGKQVATIPVYRSVPVERLPAAILQRLPEVDALPFFSPRTAELFLDLLPQGPASLPETAVIAALSPLTAEALSRRGVRVDLTATGSDGEGMIRALIDYWSRWSNAPAS